MKLSLLDKGYILFDDAENSLYTEEEGHVSLFQFAHKDLNILNEKLDSYMKAMIDCDSMELILKEPNCELSDSICSILKDSHPYYEICANETLAEAIADYLLQLIVFHTPHSNEEPGIKKMFKEAFTLTWLKPLCGHLFSSTSSYINFEEKVHQRYMDIVSNKLSIHKTPPVAFERLLLNHSRINQSLYWIVDSSVSELSELTVNERKALYDKLFPKTVDEPDLEVTRLLSFTNPHSRELLSSEFMNSNGFYTNSAMELYDYMNYGNKLSADAKKLLKAQIKKVKGNSEPLFEEYEITNLFQILFLELEQMIKKGISIKKCRHCHIYFIADKKTEYCNRIAPGETEPCKKIGPARIYKTNVENDYPLKIYQRAYGTRYAQYSRNSITLEQFDEWSKEAREKLDAVRAGTLSLDVFVKWIEETKTLKKAKKNSI